MLIKIPLKGVNAKLRAEIEARLPRPLRVSGWRFKGYVWRKLSQINTKDDQGSTDNSVRIGGTGTNDELYQSLRNGINLHRLTPSIFPDNNLLNGFNRLKNLKKLGYVEWIFAVYDPDSETATEFQIDLKEFIDDFRAAANAGDGAKVITDKEVEETGRRRFESRQDQTKSAITRWIRTLNLNWSGQKIDGVANKISKDYKRKGIIESYDRGEAKEFITRLGLGCDLLNSKDVTRALRLFPQIMDNFIQNKTTFNFALFDSDAVSHGELDSRRLEALKDIMDLHDLILKYAGTVMANPNILPYECLGAIAQKIDGEKASANGLVELSIDELEEQVNENLTLLEEIKTDLANQKLNSTFNISSSKKTQRPRFSFIDAGIPLGSVLTLSEGIVTYECVVKDEYQVEYEGESICLSPLTQRLLGIKRPIRGQAYWKYNNRLLSNIYEDVHA